MWESLCVLVLVAAAGAGYAYWFGLHRVPSGRVGLVYRRFGRHHPEDRYAVRTYGSIGWQAAVLEPDTKHWLPPLLYEVEYVPRTYVPDGTIGLVEAKAGAVRPPGQRLGRHVECDYFQDGTAFLRGGGEQGRQLDTLPGGSRYSINTKLFNVITVRATSPDRADGLTADHLREVEVLEGVTGVVIVLEGEEPDGSEDAVAPVTPGHRNFRKPWVFLSNGGKRGVQAETLTGGRYGINPWFARVVLVPTRDLNLEWTKKTNKAAGRLDSALDQIIVYLEGHRLSLEMSQMLRIPASAAPRLVRRFGEEGRPVGDAGGVVINPAPIQRFIERVLGAVVAGYFMALVGRYTILRFIEEYDEVRLELQEQVTQALRDWGVVAGQTVLAEFEAQDPAINELLRRIAAERERGKILDYERINEEIAAVTARTRIEVEAERRVAEVRKLVEQLGPRQVAIERILTHMADMKVPQIVSTGGGDIADQLLRFMPLSNAQDMLRTLIESSREAVEPGGDPPPRLTSSDGERGTQDDPIEPPPAESR